MWHVVKKIYSSFETEHVKKNMPSELWDVIQNKDLSPSTLYGCIVSDYMCWTRVPPVCVIFHISCNDRLTKGVFVHLWKDSASLCSLTAHKYSPLSSDSRFVTVRTPFAGDPWSTEYLVFSSFPNSSMPKLVVYTMSSMVFPWCWRNQYILL